MMGIDDMERANMTYRNNINKSLKLYTQATRSPI